MTFNFGPVDSLDAVPAEFRFAYNKAAGTDGKFTVQPDAQPFVTAYVGSANALEQERGKVRNLNTENQQRRQAVQAFETLAGELGVTPEGDDLVGAFRTHVSGLTEKVKGGEAFKGNLKQIQAAAEARIAEVTKTKDGELAAMRGTLESYLIDKEALAALAEAKAKNGGKVLIPHIKSKLRVVKDEQGGYTVRAVDDQGQVRYNSAQQFMGVKDVVGEIKQSPDYSFAFESEASSGTGAAPGSSQRPNSGVRPQPDQMNSTQKIQAGLDQMAKGRAA